jgi:thiopurine S-methyltransferase
MSEWNEGLTLWNERWAEDRIGFHREEVNEHLLKHADALLDGAGRVLVPLCGKSVDMVWLAEQGVEVVGVEFVDQAIQAFWEAQGVTPQTDSLHAFTRTSHGPITLLHGDIFDLQEAHSGTIDAIYDRAALIAIPAQLQQRYASHLLRLLRPGGQMLLLTYDMPLPPEQGPPYSVHPDRVPELFSAAARLTCLETVMLNVETEPKLLRRGVEWARVCAWRIEAYSR